MDIYKSIFYLHPRNVGSICTESAVETIDLVDVFVTTTTLVLKSLLSGSVPNCSKRLAACATGIIPFENVMIIIPNRIDESTCIPLLVFVFTVVGMFRRP